MMALLFLINETYDYVDCVARLFFLRFRERK